MKTARAFTLIELLVVIAIIGLLASIILASLSTARTSATVAAGKQFASTLDNALGDQAIGIWNFSECSGATMNDTSGYGNSGAIVSGLTWSTNTPNNQFCSIAMNGTNSITYAGGSTSIPIFQLGNSSFTISGWMYPTTLQSSSYSSSVLSTWGSTVRVGVGIVTSETIGIMLKDSLGNQVSPSSTQTLPLNQWSLLTMVVDRTNNVANVYLNGAPTSLTNVSISSLTGNLSFNGTTLTGASWGGTIGAFIGNVAGIRFYTKTLSAAEVRQLYADGISHLVAESH